MGRDWLESCGRDSEGAERLKEESKVSKFKVGDKVRILSVRGGSMNKVGDVGLITETGLAECRVKVEGGARCNQLELLRQP